MGTTVPSFQPPEAPETIWWLTLEKAVFPPNRADDPAARDAVVIEIPSTNDQWPSFVWSHPPGPYRHDQKFALVHHPTHYPHEQHFSLEAEILGHRWIAGGKALYEVRLVVDGDQAWGSYQGTFRGVPVAGRASAVRKPNPWKPVLEAPAIQPGEHPRLVMRRDDLEAWRAAARTPEGKAILDRTRQQLAREPVFQGPFGATGAYWAAGHGFLYLLTGDKMHAEEARQLAGKAMSVLPVTGWHAYGFTQTLLGVTLAYDACYDAWEPEFRARTAAWMAEIASIILFDTGGGMNFSPGSNWIGRTRGAIGMAGLALLASPDLPPKDQWERPSYFAERTLVMEGPRQSPEDLAQRALRALRRYATMGMGDRGWGPEGDSYHRESLEMLLPLAHASRIILGLDPAAETNLRHAGTHYARRAFLRPSDPTPWIFRYGRHHGPTSHLPGHLVVLGLSVTDPYWQPALHDFWSTHFGLRGDRTFGIQHIIEFPYALLHASTPSRNRSIEPLPRFHADLPWGHFRFRGGENLTSDFAVEFFARSGPGVGWYFPETGTFRLWGRGTSWAQRMDLRHPSVAERRRLAETEGLPGRDRRVENVVWFPDLPGNGNGSILHFEGSPDGSGSVTIDTSGVTRSGQAGRAMPGSFRALGVGFRGDTRPFFQMALLDHHPGENAGVWQMTTEAEIEPLPDGFLLHGHDGARMAVSVLAPENPILKTENSTLRITGGETFFVVFTALEDGEPVPVWTLEGSGADLRALSAGSIWKFDGTALRPWSH